VKRAIQCYNALLALYPPAFRKQFAAEMRQTFLDQYTDLQTSGGAVGIRFWLATMLDELQNIIQQYTAFLTNGNLFWRISIGKAAVCAFLFLPLYITFTLAFINLSLALPHPSISGLGVLAAFALLLFILPVTASLVVGYLIGAVLATLARTVMRYEL